MVDFICIASVRVDGCSVFVMDNEEQNEAGWFVWDAKAFYPESALHEAM